MSVLSLNHPLSNIFFSVIIGFIIFFVPTTDYYTRHYLTATMIVWATTFSLLTLFLPKLHAFFLPEKESTNSLGKASDLSGRQRTNKKNNAIGIATGNNSDEDEDDDRFSAPDFGNFENGEMMSLNYIINNSQHPFNDSKVKLSNISTKGRMQGVMMEVHEVRNFLLVLV